MNIITNDAGAVFAAKEMLPSGTKVVLFYDPAEKVLTVPEAMQLASMKALVLYDNGRRPFGGYEIGRFVGRDEKEKYVIVGEGLQIMEDENVKVVESFDEAVRLCQSSAQAPRPRTSKKRKPKNAEAAGPSGALPAETAEGTVTEAAAKKPDRKKKDKEAAAEEGSARLEDFMPGPETKGEEPDDDGLSVFNELPSSDEPDPEELAAIRNRLYEKLKEAGPEAYEYREQIVSTLQQTSHPISLQMTLGMNLHNGALGKTINEQIGESFKELKEMAEKLPSMRIAKS